MRKTKQLFNKFIIKMHQLKLHSEYIGSEIQFDDE